MQSYTFYFLVFTPQHDLICPSEFIMDENVTELFRTEQIYS